MSPGKAKTLWPYPHDNAWHRIIATLYEDNIPPWRIGKANLYAITQNFKELEKKKFVFLRSHYTSRSTLPSNGTNGLTLSFWRMGTTLWVWILVYYKILADGSYIILGFLLYIFIIGKSSKPDIIKLNSFLISEFDRHDFKVVKKILGIEVHCARWAGKLWLS